MKPHPRGHGPEQIDTHSVLEVQIDGRWQLFDATCNVYFGGRSLAELVQDPNLARAVLAERVPDERFLERHYDLYCTDWAFAHTFEIFSEEPNWLVYLKGWNALRRRWVQRQLQRAQSGALSRHA